MGLLVPRTGSAQKKPPEPLWEVDLAQFGCQTLRVPWKGEREVELWRYQRGLVFTQPDMLAAYCVVYTGNSRVSARDEPRMSDPYHLRALFFDAVRGTAVKRGEWPARPWKHSYLFGAEQGRFIVAVAGRISLYSPNLALLSEYEPPPGATPLGWMAYASPTGKSLLVSYYEPPVARGFARLLLVDTSNLSRVGTFAVQRPFGLAVWNDEVAWTADNTLYIWEPGTEPRILAHGVGFLGSPLAFLNQATLAVRAGLGGENVELVVLSTRGAILHRLSFGRDVLTVPPVVSGDGKFFVVQTTISGWFDSPVPRRITARVFSIDGARPLLTMDIPRSRDWGDLALSADGSLLAVLQGTLLRVYRVPHPASPDNPAARR